MRRIEDHAKVRGANGTIGRLTGFVLDPETLTLTHVFVRSKVMVPVGHLLPFAELGEDDRRLHVSTSTHGAALSGADNEITYVHHGGWPHPTATYDIGIVHVLGWPRVALGASRYPRWTPDDLDLVVDYDKIPKGHVELGRTSEVYSSDHKLIGHLGSVTVGESGNLLALSIHRWPAWGHRYLTVPASDIASVLTDQVRLTTSREVALGRSADHPAGMAS